jgi:hypothetical protein
LGDNHTPAAIYGSKTDALKKEGTCHTNEVVEDESITG